MLACAVWTELESSFSRQQKSPVAGKEHDSVIYAFINSVLTLKAPITTAADDKFCDVFPNFRKK